MEPDRDLDRLLRSVVPAPDPAWVRATEQRLLPRRERAGWWRRGATGERPRPDRAPLRVGAALACGLATVAVVVGLAGGGTDEDVQASDRCRTVTVTRVEQVPALVVRDGRPVIESVRKPVPRDVRRCR